ncbi:MAG: hypothetical protein ACOC1U_02670 [Spirochaetota bacterium]
MNQLLDERLVEVDRNLEDALRAGWHDASRIVAELVRGPLSAPTTATCPALAVRAGSLVVVMTFDGDARGTAALIAPADSARLLTEQLLTGEGCTDEEILSYVPAATVEIGNILMNAIVARVGRERREAYRFDVPVPVRPDELHRLLAAGPVPHVVQGAVSFQDRPGRTDARLEVLVQIDGGNAGIDP